MQPLRGRVEGSSFLRSLSAHHTLLRTMQASNNNFYRDLSDRVGFATRYARALCNVVGSGGVYSHEQVYWLESLFVSKAFPSSIVESVGRMVKDAASAPEEALVWEIQDILKKGGVSQGDKERLVQDMFRASAVNELPIEQCRIIIATAKKIGVEQASLLRIADLVDSEQQMIGAGFVSVTPLVASA
jgi:hypothetical protein